MKPKSRRILGWILWIVLLIACWVGGQVHYARRISPLGLQNVQEYVLRFGNPDSVRMMERENQTFYEFTGHLPPSYLLAIPSSPPVYVFDAKGVFVEWCSDPGDMPSYYRRWPLNRTGGVDVNVVKHKFGI